MKREMEPMMEESPVESFIRSMVLVTANKAWF
jgi:hypothetical protein